MTLIRTLLLRAARRAANDPEVRQKAGEFCRDELAPRLGAARDELRDLSQRKNPAREPSQFMRSLGRRIAEINRKSGGS